MDEAEFARLSLIDKWERLTTTMDVIASMENAGRTAYDMRRRLNPHHLAKDVKLENKGFKEHQRQVRVAQYQKWLNVKALYSTHRDEMANTLDTERYMK